MTIQASDYDSYADELTSYAAADGDAGVRQSVWPAVRSSGP